MSAWCGRLRHRALWVLACVLLAVAAAPAASGEGLLSRPTAALVLRLSPLGANASAQVVALQRRVPRLVDPAGGDRRHARVAVASPERLAVAWLERLAVPVARVRAWAAPDERYLYLINSTFLC